MCICGGIQATPEVVPVALPTLVEKQQTDEERKGRDGWRAWPGNYWKMRRIHTLSLSPLKHDVCTLLLLPLAPHITRVHTYTIIKGFHMDTPAEHT